MGALRVFAPTVPCRRAGFVNFTAAALAVAIGATWIGAEWSSRTIVALLFWVPRRLQVMAATLAVLGDFVPMGIGQSLGVRGGGNSLDNTLRVGRLVPTEWVLMDVRVHMVQRGFGHGLVHMFAEDGTLLATASQSVIVRRRRR